MRCISVVRRENETLDSLLRRYKKKMKMDNLIEEIRKRECYLSPSVIKRNKRRRKKTIEGDSLNELD